MNKEHRFEMRLDTYQFVLLDYMSSRCKMNKTEFLCDLMQKYYEENFKDCDFSFLKEENRI